MPNSFIETLLKPRPTSVKERKLWSIGLHTYWVPRAATLKAMGHFDESTMPDAVLGRPLEYNGVDKQGVSKFKVAAPLRSLEKTVRENFVEQETARLAADIEALGEKYTAVMAAAKVAAAPLLKGDSIKFKADRAAFLTAQEELAAAEAAKAPVKLPTKRQVLKDATKVAHGVKRVKTPVPASNGSAPAPESMPAAA